MQLRYNTSLSDEEYVRNQGWRAAALPCCPLHPQGECSFAHHPYLLRDMVIDRPNQVWTTDLTYIPMRRGFVYLV